MNKDFIIFSERHQSEKKAIGSLVSGFSLSLFLTIIPYLMVSNHLFSNRTLIFSVAGFAVLQFFAQTFFFLHLRADRLSWNLAAFLFAIMVVVVLVVGSLWIMYHLDMNMMANETQYTSSAGAVSQ